MKFSETIRAQPKSWIVAEALLLLLIIAYFDYLLPFEVTLLMFYFLPILYTAWYAGASRRWRSPA